MRKLTISLLAGAAALAASGAALAQSEQAPAQDLTRAAVQEHAAQAFERIDVNGDGKLDTADREARQKARFERIDADNDGSVSFAEFTAKRGAPDGERAKRDGPRGEHDGHRMGMRGMRGGYLMGMRGKADANSDGTLTEAEFTAAALSRFDAADADHDGTVTAAERKAQRDAMRGKWRERRAQQAS